MPPTVERPGLVMTGVTVPPPPPPPPAATAAAGAAAAGAGLHPGGEGRLLLLELGRELRVEGAEGGGLGQLVVDAGADLVGDLLLLEQRGVVAGLLLGEGVALGGGLGPGRLGLGLEVLEALLLGAELVDDVELGAAGGVDERLLGRGVVGRALAEHVEGLVALGVDVGLDRGGDDLGPEGLDVGLGGGGVALGLLGPGGGRVDLGLGVVHGGLGGAHVGLEVGEGGVELGVGGLEGVDLGGDLGLLALDLALVGGGVGRGTRAGEHGEQPDQQRAGGGDQLGRAAATGCGHAGAPGRFDGRTGWRGGRTVRAPVGGVPVGRNASAM